MQINKETKKLLAEFLRRIAEILFAMVVVGPFIAGNIRIESAVTGIIGMIGSLFLALLITLTIREVQSDGS